MTPRPRSWQWAGLLLAGGLGLGALLAVTDSTPRRSARARVTEPGASSPSTPLAGPSEPSRRAEVQPPRFDVALAGSRGSDAAMDTTPVVDAESEGDFHARFLELARASPEALAAQAADLLAGHAPDCEKVALLRALSDSGSPRTSEFLALAIEGLPDAASSGHESVPSFALRSLVSRAGREPTARLALERVAWESPARPSPELRRTCVAALCALATPEEATRIAGRLAVETDASVRTSGIEALAANPRAGAAEALAAFGLEPAPAVASPAGEE